MTIEEAKRIVLDVWPEAVALNNRSTGWLWKVQWGTMTYAYTEGYISEEDAWAEAVYRAEYKLIDRENLPLDKRTLALLCVRRRQEIDELKEQLKDAKRKIKILEQDDIHDKP